MGKREGREETEVGKGKAGKRGRDREGGKGKERFNRVTNALHVRKAIEYGVLSSRSRRLLESRDEAMIRVAGPAKKQKR